MTAWNYPISAKRILGFILGIAATLITFSITAEVTRTRRREQAYKEMFAAADLLAATLADRSGSPPDQMVEVQERAALPIAALRGNGALLTVHWEQNLEQQASDLHRPPLRVLREWDVSDSDRRGELKADADDRMDRSHAALERFKAELRSKLGT